MATTRERLEPLVRENFGLEDTTVIQDTDDFVDDLGADSLDAVELTIAVEEEFGIEIPDDLMEQTKTFGAAIAAIDSLLQQTPMPTTETQNV